MAIKKINITATSIAFGAVQDGKASVVNITFSNESSASTSVDVSIAIPELPFSVSPADESFTLAANGDSKIVAVTFSPLTVASFADVLELFCNNGFAFYFDSISLGSSCVVVLSGRGWLNEYQLSDIENNPAGTMKVNLIVDKYLSELTVPTANLISAIGPRKEIIDIEPAVTETQDLTLELLEDYSVYSEGFWFHILNVFPSRFAPSLPALSDRDGNEGGSGAGNWIGHGNHSIAQDATVVYEGSVSFKITATGNGDNTMNYIELPLASNTDFSAGNRFTASLWFYVIDTTPAQPNDTNISITVENAGISGGSQIFATKDPDGNLFGFGQWKVYSFEGIVQTNGSIKIYIGDLAVGRTATIWMDAIVVMQQINDPQLRFILNEDGMDRFYFWGRMNRQETKWEEYYNKGGIYVRIKTTRLISIIQTLKDMPTTQVPAQLKLYEDLGFGVVSWSLITLRDFIQGAVVVGFNQTQAFTAFGAVTSFGTHAINRTSGSFIDDGWYVGAAGRIVEQSGANVANDKKIFTVSDVEATVITVNETLTAEVSPGDTLLTEDMILIRNTDFKFQRFGDTEWINAEDCKVMSQNGDRGYWAGYQDNNLAYLSGNVQRTRNPYYITMLFLNIFDLIKMSILNFGWIARYYYGQANGTYKGDGTDKHRLELTTRGNAFPGLVVPDGGSVRTTYVGDSKMNLQNIRAIDIHNLNDVQVDGSTDQTTGSAWIVHNAPNFCPDPQLITSSDNYKQDGNTPGVLQPPNNIQFDLDLTLLFIIPAWWYNSGVPAGTVSKARSLWLHYHDGGGEHWSIALRVRYWDYVQQKWIERGSMQRAVVEYFNQRFSRGRKMIGREYSTMKFSDGSIISQSVIRPGVRTAIDDGTGSSNYYASEVVMDFAANAVAVTWIEE